MGDQEHVTESVPLSRRLFVKQLLAIGFAAPVVASFALDAGAADVGQYRFQHHDWRRQDCYAGNITTIFASNVTTKIPNFPYDDRGDGDHDFDDCGGVAP